MKHFFSSIFVFISLVVYTSSFVVAESVAIPDRENLQTVPSWIPYCDSLKGWKDIACSDSYYEALKNKVYMVLQTKNSEFTANRSRMEINQYAREIQNKASKAASDLQKQHLICPWSDHCSWSDKSYEFKFYVYRFIEIYFDDFANRHISFDSCTTLESYLEKNDFLNSLEYRIKNEYKALGYYSLDVNACLSADESILLFYLGEWLCKDLYRYNIKNNALLKAQPMDTGASSDICISDFGKRNWDTIEVIWGYNQGEYIWSYNYLDNTITWK